MSAAPRATWAIALLLTSWGLSPSRAAENPIALNAPPGQMLLLGSSARADYFPLAQEFITQDNLAFCGVASSVMVLNSLGIPAPAAAGYGSYHFWTQTNIWDDPSTKHALDPEQVKRQGMSLDDLADLLRSKGLSVELIYGAKLSLHDFRQLLIKNLNNRNDRLLINYDRVLVGQKGGGHISPLGAYHPGSDRVLIMDVARYRYPAVWVRSKDLWQAMGSTDSTSKLSRGLLIVGKGPKATNQPNPLGFDQAGGNTGGFQH